MQSIECSDLTIKNKSPNKIVFQLLNTKDPKEKNNIALGMFFESTDDLISLKL